MAAHGYEESKVSTATQRLKSLLLHLYLDETSNDKHEADIPKDDRDFPDSDACGPLLGETCDSFTYTPLSKKQTTRILLLDPGESKDELSGSIKHVISLEDHDYEALSYVWGKPNETHGLKLSGVEKRITGSLDAALRALRYPNRRRTLWVDQICINQKDVVERSRQVSTMQDIFANAEQVLVWLGEASTEDEFAFGSLCRLVDLLTNTQTFFWHKLGWHRDQTGKVLSYRSFLQFEENEHLVNLLCRAWFRRTWIIQEVASARQAKVLYGDRSISWESFAEVFGRLGNGFLVHGRQESQRSLENIAAIEKARRSNSGPLSMSLFHILVATSFSKCTDPRDKVFAVAGLAKDWVGKREFNYDYDKSLEEVFLNFAVADINRSKDLRIFSCPSHTPSLPSWVPDWSEAQNPNPFVLYSDRTKFAASGAMKAVAWLSTDQRVLHVTGKFIDGIDIVGPEPKFTKAVALFEINQTKINELKQSYEWLLDCRELALDEKGERSEERHELFWRTLLCGLTGDAFPVHHKYSRYFDQYMDFMKTAGETFKEYLDEAQTTPKGIGGMQAILTHYRAFSLVEASLSKWSSQRRICTTVNGRLASVPKGSLRGDYICTLLGADVPYILRQVLGGFSVVGECYVEGMMHGESLSHDTMLRDFRII